MKPTLCGIDIGGTKLSVALVGADGVVRHARRTYEHTCLDEECLLDLVRDKVQELCAEAGLTAGELRGVGVGMAGHISSRRGTILTTSNLCGFKNYPLAQKLSERVGAPVVLDNDANCQALAEYRFGAGKGYSDMVFLTISTGIGAGLILNGKLYRGHSGTAGEIGHAIIEPGSESVCTCGNRGCFMAHASTLNLSDAIRRKSARHPKSDIARLAAADAHDNASGRRRGALAVDGKTVYEYALRNDPLALEIVDEYADYLSILLYNIFQVLNPPVMVLGGGLMNWGDAFFERIRERFLELAGPMLFDPVAIVRAAIPADCGVIGAAALLLEE